MQYNILLESCGFSILIVSDYNLIEAFERIKDSVFIAEWSYKVCEKDYTGASVEYYNLPIRELIYKEQCVQIMYPFEEMNEGKEIIYIAMSFLEKDRQKHNCLSCHAACIEYKGNGILLFGDPGAGKTSLAIEACRRYGARLVSNDITIIDYNDLPNIRVRGGTKYLTLRHGPVLKNMPDLAHMFSSNCRDPWLNKITVSCEDIRIEEYKNPIEVNLTAMVHLDNQKDNLNLESANTRRNLLYLNENFSRDIRNTKTALITGGHLTGYIPSFDTKELFLKRSQLIECILSNAIYISGSLDMILNYLLEVS